MLVRSFNSHLSSTIEKRKISIFFTLKVLNLSFSFLSLSLSLSLTPDEQCYFVANTSLFIYHTYPVKISRKMIRRTGLDAFKGQRIGLRNTIKGGRGNNVTERTMGLAKVKNKLSRNWPNNHESEQRLFRRREATQRWEADVNTRCPPLLHLSTAMRDFNYPRVMTETPVHVRKQPLPDARASRKDTNVSFILGRILRTKLET